MVDQGTLDSIRNISQGGELVLNLVTHLHQRGEKRRLATKVKTGDRTVTKASTASRRTSRRQALEVKGACEKAEPQ